MLRYVMLFLSIVQFTVATQHPIVWGEYRPPPVTQEELREAMGWKGDLELKPLSGGFSGSPIFTVEYEGRSYVVRRSGGILGEVAVPQEMHILAAAGQVGITPELFYSNPETGLMVMEKVTNLLPPGFAPGMMSAWPDLLDQLAGLMRRVHAMQVDERYVTDRFFDVYFMDYAAKVDQTKLLTRDRAILKRMMQRRWPRGHVCLIHNDLHARNVLYDGKRLYGIDWEMAGRGPAYYDLALFVNIQCMDIASGYDFLQRYLQRQPTEAEREEFAQMRVLEACCGAVFWLAGGQNALEKAQDLPEGLGSVEGVRNVTFLLDRGMIGEGTPQLHRFGLTWLRYAEYLETELSNH